MIGDDPPLATHTPHVILGRHARNVIDLGAQVIIPAPQGQGVTQGHIHLMREGTNESHPTLVHLMKEGQWVEVGVKRLKTMQGHTEKDHCHLASKIGVLHALEVLGVWFIGTQVS